LERAIGLLVRPDGSGVAWILPAQVH